MAWTDIADTVVDVETRIEQDWFEALQNNDRLLRHITVPIHAANGSGSPPNEYLAQSGGTSQVFVTGVSLRMPLPIHTAEFADPVDGTSFVWNFQARLTGSGGDTCTATVELWILPSTQDSRGTTAVINGRQFTDGTLVISDVDNVWRWYEVTQPGWDFDLYTDIEPGDEMLFVLKCQNNQGGSTWQIRMGPDGNSGTSRLTF